MSKLNSTVTKFINDLNLPLRIEIEQLRIIILDSVNGMTENIKWNSPNYCFDGSDRITMRIHAPKQIQLIFHRGAKKQEHPKEKLIQVNAQLLDWKENDRAVFSFKNIDEIKHHKKELIEIVKEWIYATKND